LRVQFIEVSFVEPSRDGFVDIGDYRVVPEPRIFLCGIKTVNLSRAGDEIQSVNRVNGPQSGPTTYVRLRGGPRRLCQRHPEHAD